jgi:hypothetical protein
MDYGLYRIEEPYTRPVRRRVNYFGWTVAILLLIGFALAAWLGSFYIFGQPERPDSYRILQKLHKIEPPRRFELTAAPAGEFLDAKKIYDRYSAMGSAELAKTNAELARNYIRNYQQVRGLVPYVVGRYVIMKARDLGPNDVFTTGMVALTSAVENGALLMEHVYPADTQTTPLIKETLKTGLELKMDRAHDLSAIIHVERLRDGHIMITAVPLLYGTYTILRGTGTFTLEPPSQLNLEAGWPLFKQQERLHAQLHFANYRKEEGGAATAGVPIPGLTPTATPVSPENQLVRVEEAKPVVETPAVAEISKERGKRAAARELSAKKEKESRLAKKHKAASEPSPSEAVEAPAKKEATPARAVAVAIPSPTFAPEVALASPVESPPPAVPVQPFSADSSTTLASTAGGGTWKTYAPGRMPLGRLISPPDIGEIADRGTAGERIYLKGQFVVNFADANRAVLRPRSTLSDTVLHFGAGSPTRIIVEFPSGYTPPAAGSVISRDAQRPFEITEIRRQKDGQLNVFAREIMQP